MLFAILPITTTKEIEKITASWLGDSVALNKYEKYEIMFSTVTIG